jgi:hypothetical protein
VRDEFVGVAAVSRESHDHDVVVGAAVTQVVQRVEDRRARGVSVDEQRAGTAQIVGEDGVQRGHVTDRGSESPHVPRVVPVDPDEQSVEAAHRGRRLVAHRSRSS